MNRSQDNNIVIRERLFKILDRYSVVGIFSIKGSGKATLINSYAEARNSEVVWINCHHDSGIRKIDLSNLSSQAVVVFDLTESPLEINADILNLIENGIHQNLPNIKTIIIGIHCTDEIRHLITSARDSTLLFFEALAFNQEESTQYFNDLHNLNFEQSQISYIRRKTTGWILCYNAFYEAVQFKSSFERDMILTDLVHSIPRITGPLVEDLLGTIDSETMQFLEEISLMEFIIPEIVDDYLRIENSNSIIDDLLRTTSFIYRLPDGKVTCHYLFRQYLYGKYAEHCSKDDLVTAHRNLSLAYEKHYYYAEAYIHAAITYDIERLSILVPVIRDRYAPEDLISIFVSHLTALYPSVLTSTAAGIINRSLPPTVSQGFVRPLLNMISVSKGEKNYLQTAQLQFFAGIIELTHGNLYAGKSLLQDSIKNVSLIGANTLMSSALSYLATCCRAMQKDEEGLKYAQKALYISEQSRHTYAQAITLDEMAWLVMRKGNPKEAEALLSQAMEIASADRNMVPMFLYVTMSSCQLSQDNNDAALEWAKKAVALAQTYGFDYDLSRSNYALGKVYRVIGDNESAMDAFNTALSYSDNYEHMKAAILSAQIKILKSTGDLLNSSRKESELQEICRYHKYSWFEPKSDYVSSVNYSMEINTLGKFTINGEDASSIIKRTSSMEILQFLICKYSSGASKDVIMDTVFPYNPSKSLNQFGVSLSELRKALEPTLSHGSQSSYIQRVADRYSINCSEIKLDVAFIDEICHGKSMDYQLIEPDSKVVTEDIINDLLTAKNMFKGEFMEDYPYTAFIEGYREKYRLLHFKILKNLGDFCFSRQEYYDFIKYYDQIIETYPYLEEVYFDYINLLLSINAFFKAKDVSLMLIDNIDPAFTTHAKIRLDDMFLEYGINLPVSIK